MGVPLLAEQQLQEWAPQQAVLPLLQREQVEELPLLLQGLLLVEPQLGIQLEVLLEQELPLLKI